MQKNSTSLKCLCQILLLGLAVLGSQLRAADAKKTTPRGGTTDDAQFTFPNFIDVSACAGFSLQWVSQGLQVDHATGNFNTTWSPTEPNVLNCSGHLDATTLTATLKCPSGTGPVGTITATGSNNVYTGTYTLGAATGPVNIVLTPGGGGEGSNNKKETLNATLTPNPAKVGDTVVFKGILTPDQGHVVTAADMGTLSFGDGSPDVTLNGLQFIPQFKEPGFSHVYQSEGVFDIHLHLFNTSNPLDSGADFDFFEVVGSAPVAVNGATGVNVTSSVSGGGAVGLQIHAQLLSGAADATTSFEDAGGNPVPPAGGTLQGFTVGQTVAGSGLVVGSTNVLDAVGTTIGQIRKTVGVSDTLAGVPNGLANPASTALSVKSLKGKFTFNQSKSDDVAFSAQFMLPPGFSFARSGANEMQFSMGNVVDTVQLDTKGNLKSASRGRITKLSVKIPKLAQGVAVGGEPAKLTAQFSATGMTGSGFNTEGITSQRGTNETGKVLTRFIQVNMLFAGVAYEVLAPVNYVISPDSSFGSIAGRHQ